MLFEVRAVTLTVKVVTCASKFTLLTQAWYTLVHEIVLVYLLIGCSKHLNFCRVIFK